MRIGVLGGGQLGKMLALSGIPLGHECVFLDPHEDACAAPHGTHIVGSFDDQESLKALAEQSDVVTYESENLPVEAIEFIEQYVPVFPPKAAVAVAQDRLKEKNLCTELGILTAAFAAVENLEALKSAVIQIGFPCILKTTRMGYDGKGQVSLDSEEDIPEAEKLLATQECVLEERLSFQREVSVISTRAASGETVMYPVTENVHKEGILHTSRAPAVVDAPTTDRLHSITDQLLRYFGYVGTMAIEFFVMPNGDVLLNEIAPRVHNSGHWTIEGAKTSQFENHVRALCGSTLGSTDACGQSVMVNVIGTFPKTEQLEGRAGVFVHVYGKAERPKRKIGHITVCDDDPARVESLAKEVLDAVATAHP